MFSIFILNACAGNITKEKAICTTDGAYATGYNDGSANNDMIPNFAISKCSSLHLNQLTINDLNREYFLGYKNGKGKGEIRGYQNSNVRNFVPNRRFIH